MGVGFLHLVKYFFSRVTGNSREELRPQSRGIFFILIKVEIKAKVSIRRKQNVFLKKYYFFIFRREPGSLKPKKTKAIKKEPKEPKERTKKKTKIETLELPPLSFQQTVTSTLGTLEPSNTRLLV